MKSYTNWDQSKKLVEILPAKSADMYYNNYDTINANILYIPGDSGFFKFYEYAPCWSLATLLAVMPTKIPDDFDDGSNYELEIDMVHNMPRYVRLDMYHSQFPYDFEKETLLDNIVESIIWLNNTGHLSKDCDC